MNFSLNSGVYMYIDIERETNEQSDGEFDLRDRNTFESLLRFCCSNIWKKYWQPKTGRKLNLRGYDLISETITISIVLNKENIYKIFSWLAQGSNHVQ